MNTRRLPVYIVFDASGPMTGEPMQAAKTQLNALLEVLDKHSRRQHVFVSVITVSSFPKIICPLSPLDSVLKFRSEILRWKSEGVFVLGQTLRFVKDRMLIELYRSREQKDVVDYRPILVLLTNGYVCDNFEKHAIAIKKEAGAKIVIHTVGSTKEDEEILKLRITDEIFSSRNSGAEEWSQYIQFEEYE